MTEQQQAAPPQRRKLTRFFDTDNRFVQIDPDQRHSLEQEKEYLSYIGYSFGTINGEPGIILGSRHLQKGNRTRLENGLTNPNSPTICFTESQFEIYVNELQHMHEDITEKAMIETAMLGKLKEWKAGLSSEFLAQAKDYATKICQADANLRKSFVIQPTKVGMLACILYDKPQIEQIAPQTKIQVRGGVFSQTALTMMVNTTREGDPYRNYYQDVLATLKQETKQAGLTEPMESSVFVGVIDTNGNMLDITPPHLKGQKPAQDTPAASPGGTEP